jgi:hypothetical protein
MDTGPSEHDQRITLPTDIVRARGHFNAARLAFLALSGKDIGVTHIPEGAAHGHCQGHPFG